MANDIQFVDVTGLTLYAFRQRPTDGHVYNTVTPGYEAIVFANWAQYVITITEVAGTGFYFGTSPAASLSSIVRIFSRSGVSPAAGDVPWADGEDSFIAADLLLDRDMGSGIDTGADNKRTVRQALRPARNKFTVAPDGTYSSFKEDDATISYTSQLSTTPNAAPITSSDPAGP